MVETTSGCAGERTSSGRALHTVLVATAIVIVLLTFFVSPWGRHMPAIPAAADVKSISVLLDHDKEIMSVSNRTLISDFLNILRSLPAGSVRHKPSANDFFLRNGAGDIIMAVWCDGKRNIVLKYPDGTVLDLPYRARPLLGKLYACGRSQGILNGLERMSMEKNWDYLEQRAVESDIEYLITIMPEARPMTGSTPVDLAASLDRIRKPSVDNLDRFADYYEVRY